MRRLGELIDSLAPSLLYAPQPNDDHPDHRAAARLVTPRRRALARAAGDPLLRDLVAALQTWTRSWTSREVIDDKRRAIRAYRSQCAVMRLDDAFLGLARYRGEMHSWPGGPYAEVFRLG